MLVEGIQSVLAANAPLVALLGTPSNRPDENNGIFPLLAPEQPTMPYIVYQQITGNPLQESMQGTGRLQTSRWRFSCYGTTYKNAKLVAQALREVLISFYGLVSSANVQISGSWLKLEADDAEPLLRGTLYCTHVDVEILYMDLH